jgi:hypothetical protein
MSVVTILYLFTLIYHVTCQYNTNRETSISSSPLSMLKYKSDVYTVRDNAKRSSGQILSLSLIFDQQIFYRRPGCGGKPTPVGSSKFGYQNRLGNIHGSVFCNGTVLSLFNQLTILPIPSNSFMTLNKYTKTIQKEKLKELEGNVFTMLVDIPGKAKIRSKIDVGTCILNLHSCKFSTDMPGGSISNFAGREFINQIIFQESGFNFQPPMLILQQISYGEQIVFTESQSKLGADFLVAQNLQENPVQRAAGSGMYFRKFDEETMAWIIEQVNHLVNKDLGGDRGDSARPGGMHKDPLQFVSDMLKLATQAGNMIAEGIKLGGEEAKEKADLAASQGAVAFLETRFIKINETDKGISNVQIDSLKSVVIQTLKHVNETTEALYKSLKDSIKFTKSLNELHELLFAYDSQVNKIDQTLEKGEFWNQFAYETAVKASEKYQHLISVNEHTIHALLNSIEKCKSSLKTYKLAIDKTVRSVVFSKYSSSNKMFFFSESELYIRQHMKHVNNEISKYTKERELLNMNLRRREEDGSFLEATTNEQLVAQLNMQGKGTLMQLLKEGHYLHSTGQAKHRIEEDQWIELGAGTKVDEFLGMRHSSQTKLDAEDRLNQNMEQKGIPEFIRKLGLGMSPESSMPAIGSVGKRLVKILSHSLTSELATMLTDKISGGLHGPVTQYLVDRVTASVPERVATEVSDALTTSLQTTVSEMVPMLTTRLLTGMLEKTMFRSLVDLLTRGLTHTLTSTLTYTLSMSPDEHVHCYNCKHHGLNCDDCTHGAELSDENLLALHYYGSYYSDYYSEYYSVKDIHHEPPFSREPEGVTPVSFQSKNMEGR